MQRLAKRLLRWLVTDVVGMMVLGLVVAPVILLLLMAIFGHHSK